MASFSLRTTLYAVPGHELLKGFLVTALGRFHQHVFFR